MNFYPIFWREMLTWKREFRKTFISSLIGPLLYLVTFGWGLGRRIPIEGINYLDFVVPGIIALSALNTSYNAISSDLNIRRTLYRTFEQYVIAPVSIHSVVTGEVLAGTIRGLFSCSLVIILGYLFGANLHLSLSFFLVLAFSCFTFASLGVLAAMANDTHRDLATFGTLFIMPMSFLAGTFFKVSTLPIAVKYLIYCLPLTPTSLSLRSLALGNQISFVPLLAVACWAILMFIGALAVTKMKYAD